MFEPVSCPSPTNSHGRPEFGGGNDPGSAPAGITGERDAGVKAGKRDGFHQEARCPGELWRQHFPHTV